jgi:hypothetical protein
VTLSPSEWRTRIEGRPLPGDGRRPWEGREGEDGYEIAGETLARCMLAVIDGDPGLLSLRAERASDPSGLAAAQNDKLEAALNARWPDRAWDRWCGGVTGFQWGWAHNIVRYIHGAKQTGNPAVMTIGDGDA